MTLKRASADIHVSDDDWNAFFFCKIVQMLFHRILAEAVADSENPYSVPLRCCGCDNA